MVAIMWYKDGIWCDSETDTDGDELPDCGELVLGTDINKTDTDGDEIALGLNPLVKDTDGDGIPDCDEKIQQTITQEISEEEKPQVRLR